MQIENTLIEPKSNLITLAGDEEDFAKLDWMTKTVNEFMFMHEQIWRLKQYVKNQR